MFDTKKLSFFIPKFKITIDYEMFKRRFQNWANYKFKGLVDALPEGLKPLGGLTWKRKNLYHYGWGIFKPLKN